MTNDTSDPQWMASAADEENIDTNATGTTHSPEIPESLPVLTLRDVAVFNYMIIPLFVGREHSMKAVQKALDSNRLLLVLAQKEEHIEEPQPEQLYTIGTVVMVMRMLKMPDGRLKLLVQGLSRARAESIIRTETMLEAKITPLPEPEVVPDSLEIEALMRSARELSEKILQLRGLAAPDISDVLAGVDHPGRMADLIASNLRLRLPEAQTLLECLDPAQRLLLVNGHLLKEVDVASMQAKIQDKAREGMDKAQKEYFLREQLKAIRTELGEGATSEEESLSSLIEALDKAKLPTDVKKEADKQLARLRSMHQESAEANVIRSYLEWFADLPWQKQSRDSLNIGKAATILDEDHYGLARIKDRILEYLSVRKLNPRSKGPILCFVGPPGVGKTSLGRSIARALGRKFQRFSLGGMRDEAEIRGHRRTYVGALPGRIIQALKQAETRNPVIMLDEVDKLGTDFRGDPSSALLEVLDPEQNNSFTDHYLAVPFDLSKVMFICTANSLDTIPSALRDRMEIIRIAGYTEHEKTSIAVRYLLPRQIQESGLKKHDVQMDAGSIRLLISEYTREAGLRNLEREIGSICRKLARRKAEGETGPFTVTAELVHNLLGAARFIEEEHEKTFTPGVAYGLAWTPFGGEVLNVEVLTMKGKGHLQLTGQLGDVMKESAQAAVSYARSHAKELKIDADFNEKLDLHIHVPAGATPKDGPSAGVTLAIALISALTGKPVRADLCMTGEITLRGRVLPVGGIKEKILAAVTLGIKHAMIPKVNMKDLEDIPKDLLEQITIHPIDSLDAALKLAFTKK